MTTENIRQNGEEKNTSAVRLSFKKHFILKTPHIGFKLVIGTKIDIHALNLAR